MLQKKLVYVIFLSFGMRFWRVGWMVPVPLMHSLGRRRRPHSLASPLSHLAASGPLISVLSDVCFPAVNGLVDKFDMW